MASINSRPLFIIVALSMVIFAPMLQFGWRTARSGVTSRVCSSVQPRNGPPEPVRRMRRSSLLSRPARHWKIAECSESTGRISRAAARGLRHDDLARAHERFLCSQARCAASDGWRRASGEDLRCRKCRSQRSPPHRPWRRRQGTPPFADLDIRVRKAPRSSFAAAGSITEIYFGRNCRACSASRSTSRRAASASTEYPRRPAA